MSKTLKELVEIVKFKLNLNNEDVAKRLGYSRGHLSILVKSNDTDCIEKIKMEFPEILQNDTNGNTNDILKSMIEVQKIFAEAHKDLTAAHRVAQDDNSRLISMVDSSLKKSNLNSHQERPLMPKHLMEQLAESLASKLSLSQQELLSLIGSSVNEIELKKHAKSSRSEFGK